jgi:parvulin-like peptidyl-prolyl isomerase
LAAENEFFDVSNPSNRRSMVFLACGALIGLAIAAYGLFTAKGTRSSGVPAEAVALVNQRQILRSDFMTQTETQYSVPFAQTTREQRKKILEDMIDEELMMQRGLEIDLPSSDPDVRNALVAGVELEVTADVVAQQPTSEELHAYYERHRSRYSSEGIMQLRDLVVRPDASRSAAAAHAVAIKTAADIRAGQPLDEVIKRYGLVDSGRFMAAGHTDLGDIFEFAVRAKVDDALYNALSPLKDGEISDPVDESDGVHLIAMIKRRLPVSRTFEQASNRAWADVKREAEAKVRAANLVYLHGRADIVIAPDYAQ